MDVAPLRIEVACGHLGGPKAARRRRVALGQRRLHPDRHLEAARAGVVAQGDGREEAWNGRGGGHGTRHVELRQIRAEQVELWLKEREAVADGQIRGIDLY